MIKGKFNLEEVCASLNNLKLSALADAVRRQEADPVYETMTFVERVGCAVDEELNARLHRRQFRLFKDAGISMGIFKLQSIIYNRSRNLKKETFEMLATCRWMTQDTPLSVLITGPSGTGKTYLAKTLGTQACMKSLTVAYYRLPVLLEELEDATLRHNSATFRRRLANKRLLIIDDFGMGQFTEQTRTDLLSLIDERVGSASTIIAGQLPFEKWHDFIGNPYTADALMDRLINSSYKIQLKGRSLRELSRPDDVEKKTETQQKTASPSTTNPKQK